MRLIKLPDLLIEVDNDLKFTQKFMNISQLTKPTIEIICVILAAIMAHGCNIGAYTMSHLVDGISYKR
jgi:Transposase.